MSADFYLTLKSQQQNVGHKWSTGIVPHMKGSEQRSSYFTWPRLVTQTKYTQTTDFERHWIERNVYKYGWQIVGMPLWHDQMLITTAVSGALTVTVDSTLQRHLTIGRELLLIKKSDPDIYCAASIAATTNTTISLATVLNHNYTGEDSYCVPVVESRITISPGIQTSRVSDTFFDIRGEEDYSQQRDYFYVPPASTASTYLGYEVVDFRFEHTKTFRYSHQLNEFSHIGMSYFESNFAATDTNISADVKINLIGRSEIWDFWTLFDSKQGSYEPFWLPTWTRDMTIIDEIESTDLTIKVVPNEYDQFYLGNDIINRHVLFYFPDRTWTCRKILAYSNGTITLATPMGIDLTLNQAEKTMVSFLIFSRFDADVLVLQYKAGQAADIGFSTQGLIQEDL